MQLSPLPRSRFEQWRAGVRDRLVARNRQAGLRIGADAEVYADRFVSGLLPQGARTRTASILTIAHRGREVGTVWVGINRARAFIVDLDLAIADAPIGDLYPAIEGFVRARGAVRLSIALFPGDAAVRRLIDGRGFATASIQMLLEPLPRRRERLDIDVSPMTAERFAGYVTTTEAAFARDLAASGRATADEAVKEAARQLRAELPDGLDTPGQSLFTASVGGVEVGTLWVGARLRGDRPHAFVLDVEVAEAYRRRGYGRQLMLAAEREARAIGADSVGLHVFGVNEGAIALYEQLGYRRVEEMLFRDL